MSIFVKCPVDYINGYIKYGGYKGYLDIPREDEKIFVENPVKYIIEHDLMEELEIYIDEVSIENVGKIYDVDWNVV